MWRFGSKVHMKAWGRMGMKIYTNELGHMTNMAAMPIYSKNLKKSSSPEPIDWWLWNLVCNIVYVSATKIVQSMTLGWPWLILRRGQIWSHRILYGKKGELLFLAHLSTKCSWWAIVISVCPSSVRCQLFALNNFSWKTAWRILK